MPDILHQVIVAAEPEKVYEALTEQNGLSGWWTTNASAEARVGAVDEFRFFNGEFVIKIEVAELEPGKKVAWNIKQSVPDWEGSHITWNLAPVGQGTKLLFGQYNYNASPESFATYNYNWGVHLTSLKAYLETGKGTPKS
ncbi:MAG TPA: SRPBCC domain-containing protein [Chloroflexia bacterium]|nr:SRPBCC domain-containing protein [Chloroflexia bacterium]